MSSDYFKSGSKSLESILNSECRYFVPQYQRSYCWDTQVEQFWEDLLDSIKEERPFYFFGQIALKRADNKMQSEIIDGQQRLATVTILISLIRERLQAISQKKAQIIHSRYIAKEDIRTLENESRLTLNKEDSKFFDKYIVSFDNHRNKETLYKMEMRIPTSNRLIFNARAILKDKINAYASGDAEESILLDLCDYLLKKFVVMETIVDDEADAFTIFETLNERGLDLTIADLLKNFLLSRAGNKLNEVQRYWDNMVLLVSDSKISEFLRHFWLSSHGVVRQKMLFRKIKDHLKGKDVFKFIEELSKEAEIYSNLKNPTPDVWTDSDVYDDLRSLRVLNVTQCLPFLLSAYVALPLSKFKKVVRLAVVMSFRYSTICNKNARNLEDLYSDIALNIRSGKYKLAEIRKELTTLYPDDETFLQEFAKKSITTTRVARYILDELDQAMHSTGEERPDKVSLEHVLPQSPEQNWNAHMRMHHMEHKDLVNRLGNLTLLGPGFNKKVARELFPKKLPYYKKSTLPITKTLTNYSDWREAQIDDRQKKLGLVAVSHWHF